LLFPQISDSDQSNKMSVTHEVGLEKLLLFLSPSIQILC